MVIQAGSTSTKIKNSITSGNPTARTSTKINSSVTSGNQTGRTSTKIKSSVTSGNPTGTPSTKIENPITSGNPTTATSTQESSVIERSRGTDVVRNYWWISLIVIPVLLIGVFVIWISIKRKRNR